MYKKVFFQMSIAQIISSMTVILCLLIDSIMIGRFLGVNPIAAYGLANPLLLVFAGIGSMISAGAQVMCSKSFGCGNQEDANAFYSITLTLCLGISLIGLVLVGLFSGPIAELLGADSQTTPELYSLTKDYLVGFIIGIPAFLSATVLVPFLQLTGKQNVLILSVVIMIIGDIVLDLLNVFVFEGGMLGMGLASSLSYYLACFMGLSYFLRKDCAFKFRLKSICVDKIKKMLVAGVPTIINMFSLVLLSFTLNRILLTLGNPTESVAAYSIISTASNICYCFSTGLATVALTLSGVYYCENDKRTLIELLKLTLKAICIVDIIVVAIVLIIAPLMVQVFMQEGQDSASALATTGLRIFVISLLPCGITAGLKNYYQGTLHIKLTCFISAFQNYLCIAGFSFLLSRFLDTTGVWLGYICGETLVLLLIVTLVMVKSRSFGFSAEKFTLLPKDFGVPDDHFLRATLKSMDDVTEFSEKTAEFCRKLGANSRCCFYTALAVEEICNNTFTYGYNEKMKKAVEVSIFFKQPELILRIRDEAKAFNPVEYFNIVNSEDATKHIGIRMVFPLAKEVKYSNSLSQNSLTLTMDSSSFSQ